MLILANTSTTSLHKQAKLIQSLTDPDVADTKKHNSTRIKKNDVLLTYFIFHIKNTHYEIAENF